jgi:hypothetical protein
MKIIDSRILSNLTVGNDNLGEFECRTSLSNPQAILTIIRQSNDGVKHSDIQYRTPSTYINGINSIRFVVRKEFCRKLFIFIFIFSYLKLIFLYMEIF